MTKAAIINLLLRISPNAISERRRYKFVRRIAKIICWLYSIKIIAHDQKHWLDGSVMLIANHQSNFDSIVLMALNNFKKVAPIAIIAKQELRHHFLGRYFLSMINLILIDRHDLRSLPKYLASGIELIKIPRTLLLFPSGTRSHGSTVGQFKSFFLRIAYKTYSPIVPVALINTFQIKSWTWRRNYVHLFFLPPIKPGTFAHRSLSNLTFQLQRQIQKTINEHRVILNSQQNAKKIYFKTKQKLKSEQKKQKIKYK